MDPFNKLPGFVQSPPGLEHRIWRKLPAIWLWGSLLPVLLAMASWVFQSADMLPDVDQKALLLWDFVMLGWVMVHWMLVLTVGLACFIVRVMKGPAYVADAYPLPEERPEA